MEIKNQRTMKKERLDDELKWMQSVGRFTAVEVAEKYGVSRYTACGDIKTLMETHPEIEAVGSASRRYYEWVEQTPEWKKPGIIYEMKTHDGIRYLFLEIDRTPWAVYGFRAYPTEYAPLAFREESRFPEFAGTNGRRYFVDAARLRTQSSKSVENGTRLAEVRDIMSVVEAMYGRYSFT